MANYMKALALVTGVTVLTTFSGPALATMPVLTDKPTPATLASCTEWATKQDDDALYMWGITESGESSKGEAIQRLINSCLGRPVPDIVGWDSSAGFNDRYCQKHTGTPICRKYQESKAKAAQQDQAPKLKLRKPAKLTENWPTDGLWKPGYDGCDKAKADGDLSDDYLTIKGKSFRRHEWSCDLSGMKKGTEGRYTLSMTCSGEGDEEAVLEVDSLVMLSSRFIAMNTVSTKQNEKIERSEEGWNLYKYCGILPENYN